MRHAESAEQQYLVRWARLHPVARLMYAIPNGGARSKVTAAILKAEGVLAGVPDLHLPVARGGAHSLYIEMKAGKGRLEAHQAQIIDLLVAEGHVVVVAWAWDRAAEWVEAYLRGEIQPSLIVDKCPRRNPLERSTLFTPAPASRR